MKGNNESGFAQGPACKAASRYGALNTTLVEAPFQCNSDIPVKISIIRIFIYCFFLYI